MKPKFNTRITALTAAFAVTLGTTQAATYYWDNNGAAAGFGDAGGTWTAPTIAQWSTSAAGTATPGNVTTTTSDTLFFGLTTTGLGAGEITVDGTVAASELVFSAGSGAIKLAGGTINFVNFFVPRNIPGGTAVTGTILVNAPGGADIQSSITGASSVFVKSVVGNPDTVAGGPLTLSGVNTVSGPTINRGGVLVLGNNLALQNSPVRTTSSITGTATVGLRTTVPTLTLGGLEGGKDFESVFSTVDSGYSDLTDLTLNLGTNRNEVYSGGIGEGAAGMNLTITGGGTQVFAGTHSYTGSTTLSAGILLTTSPAALPGYDSAGKVVIGGGTLGAAVGGSGWSTSQIDTLLSNATKTSGHIGIDTSAGDLVQWTAFTASNLGGLGLRKLGANTLTLNQANSYTGTTILSEGTLSIQNPGTGLSQTLTPIDVKGFDATLRSDYNGGSGTLSTSFVSIARVAGSTANLEVVGGTNGTDNLITIGGSAGFIDWGVFFGGSDYAALNSDDGFVRALAYGSDPDTEVVDTITADKHVKLTASPAARPGDTLRSLNLAGGGVDYTMDSGSLTAPGILKSGGGAGSSITGGTGVTSGVIRTDTSADHLTITTPVTGSGGLTKSGEGTLTLSAAGSNYTGETFVNGGTLEVGRTTNYNLDAPIRIAEGAKFHFNSASGNLIINSLITGGGTLEKSGAGTLTMRGANSFTGGTIINGGTVVFEKIYDDSFGTGGAITLNAAAALTFSSAPTQSSFITFNRGFTLNSGAIVRLNYSGNATITGPVSGTGGIWSANTNNTQNTLNLINTANTFTGPVILNGGGNIQPNTVVVNSLADSTSPIQMKSGASGGQALTFSLGTGAVAPLTLNSRPIELGITGAAGGYAISNLNTDPSITLTINTNVTHGIDANTTGTRVLTFGGVNTGNNTFGGVISNGTGGQIIAVTKAAAGTWTLSNNNTYTGLTTVGAGILNLTGSVSSGGVTVNGTGLLNIGNANALGSGTLTLGGNSGPSLDNTSGSALTVATNNVQTWNGDFTFVGTNDLNLGTGAVTLGGTRLVTVTANTLTVGGIIGAATSTPGIQKLGAGTMVLNGVNTYQGNTSIVGGTLTLGVDDCLDDASNVLIGNGILNLNAGVNDTVATLDVTTTTSVINLGSGATIAFANSSAVDWTGGEVDITGDFVAGASIRFGTTSGGLTPAQLGLITVNGSGSYTLDASGYLIEGTPGTPYQIWSGGAAFDADANGDGVDNGLAFLLGAVDLNANATGLLPTVTQSGGDLVLTFSMLNAASRGTATLSVQHSSDLGIIDPWASALVPESTNTISGVNFVVTPGGSFNDVVATIPSTEAAAGKLFGRLEADE